MTTILVIDDSASERAAIRCALEPSGLFSRIVEAEDGLVGLRLLLSEAVDVVLCDLEMPGLDGEKLLRVRENAGRPRVPFLFLTGNTDDQRKARLLTDGASDTITKPFHPADLVARLRSHLRVWRLECELREKNETLRRLSLLDGLTGLYNRRYLSDALSVEFQRAVRYQSPLAVLMLDLDHFKQLNDAHGHLVGDAALAAVAAAIRSTVRQADVAGRYGGEEFLVIAPHTGPEGAARLAERLRQAIHAVCIPGQGGGKLRLSASLGVAVHRSEHASPEDLLGEADAALYRAKQTGRNRVEVSGS
jgi:diguanylate cyclase (GGDEF)-like protein